MSNSRRFDGPLTYQIRVHGKLDPRWSHWFEDLHLIPAGEETILEGQIVDQAALQGLLMRIHGLGLPLIAVSCETCATDSGECS